MNHSTSRMTQLFGGKAS